MKILLIDDHALFRAGMKYVLQELSPLLSLLEAGSCTAATGILEQHDDLDLILLDLSMPGLSGAACLTQICLQAKQTPVVILTADERPEAIQLAHQRNVQGFIQKSDDAESMLPILKKILDGQQQLPVNHLTVQAETPLTENLTARQKEILALIAQGKSNKQIAGSLGITEGTTRIHVTSILKTLGVRSRSEAICKVLNSEDAVF